jgi:signal transduction histidine kinase/ligand-binding sensor domain-containing protein/DNA-binding response OmpR family regulator
MMQRCVRVILLGLGLFITHQICAQQPIRFRHITYKDGLIQSPIATMLQDKDGYVWIGSWGGLSRYDGTNFKSFRPSDTSVDEISHNRINRLYEDREGRLWIGTGGGLNLYNKTTEKFQHIGLSAAKGGGNFITAIQQDHSGRIWVASFKGVKFVTRDNKSLVSMGVWKNKEPELFQGVVFSLAEDKFQTIWAGVNQGLERFDPDKGTIIQLPEPVRQNKELAAAKIIVIKQAKDGDLWFGTENSGIFCYRVGSGICNHYTNQINNPHSLPSNWINDLLVKDGLVMAATRNGLAIFDPVKGDFNNYNHDPADFRTLTDGSVWSMMTDHTGNVWIGTYSGGINIYYQGNSNFSNIGERIGSNIGLNKPLAEAIVGDSDGGLWIGSFGGGLNYINRTKNIASYFPVSDARQNKFSNEVKALIKDSLKNLWAGTLDGLFKFDRNKKTFSHINLETNNNKTGAKLINALLATKDGIWVGTNGAGLKLVNYQGGECLKLSANSEKKNWLSDNYINCLCSQGDAIWIGTQNGLNRYDPRSHTFKSYRRKTNGLGNNNVLSLYVDSHQRLWIGTDGGGLNYLDERDNRIYPIRQSDGLADDVVAAIIADNSGALWVSTNNGISKLTFGGSAFPLARGNYQIANYTAANGLQSNQFLVNSAYRTPEGEMLFGGMNGVVTFFPDKIIKNKFKPEILLTGFNINNKEVAFGKGTPLQAPINVNPKLTLAYNQNNLTIKFSALNFINPERNIYAYKMAGLPNNEGWITIGNQKEVSFNNLAPGHYIFTVKAANNDGYWNNKGRSLQINIRPPLWETWWAYCIYIVLAIFIFYKIIQFFQIRARLERDLYNEHLQNERQEEFYKMKLDFFTNISHEIRTPLTLILGPLESLYNRTMDNALISRQVLQVKNNAERLLRLVGELMDFRKAETGNMVLYVQHNNVIPFVKEIFLSFTALAESRNISYTFTTDQPEIYLYTDHDQLEKVFFNLLSNAFKFTPDYGRISMDVISSGQPDLTIIITDNGKGIPAEHQAKLFNNFYQVHDNKSNMGTGVGLALAKNIVELHQGTITFQSSVAKPGSEGHTAFTVKLPFNFIPANNVHLITEVPGGETIASFRMQTEIDVLRMTESAKTALKGSVVLAEDNQELRNFISDSLPDYKVSSFENGLSAFEYSVSQIPDLIISDVMMPGMDGLELCRKIKSDDRTSHIPVILLTALATHIHQVNGMETGADAYLTKPFSIKLLELHVHNLLNSREMMRRKFSQQIILHPQQVLLNNPDERFLKKLMNIIDEQMENPEFGVVALGTEIGMSKSVLYKKICALTNLSPADFIKSMRLKKAADLLQQKILSVNEVAVLVGFNDRKYFSREFKKMHGKSPSEIATSA